MCKTQLHFDDFRRLGYDELSQELDVSKNEGMSRSYWQVFMELASNFDCRAQVRSPRKDDDITNAMFREPRKGVDTNVVLPSRFKHCTVRYLRAKQIVLCVFSKAILFAFTRLTPV